MHPRGIWGWSRSVNCGNNLHRIDNGSWVNHIDVSCFSFPMTLEWQEGSIYSEFKLHRRCAKLLQYLSGLRSVQALNDPCGSGSSDLYGGGGVTAWSVQHFLSCQWSINRVLGELIFKLPIKPQFTLEGNQNWFLALSHEQFITEQFIYAGMGLFFLYYNLL